MAWEKISEQYEMKPGEMYRIGLQIKAPFSTWLGSTICNAIKFGNSMRNLEPWRELHDKADVTACYYVQAPATNRTARNEPWWVYIELRKRTSNPVPLALYGILFTIVFVTTAVMISGKTFERFVTTVGGEVHKTLHEVLNPGLVLGGFVLGYLALTRR